MEITSEADPLLDSRRSASDAMCCCGRAPLLEAEVDVALALRGAAACRLSPSANAARATLLGDGGCWYADDSSAPQAGGPSCV